MKIKTKLTLGVGLLFLLIVLLTIVSVWYINGLKQDTRNILSANYNTLEYSRNMILALDEMTFDSNAIVKFEMNLEKQKKNETEPGEKEVTDQIASHFKQLKESKNISGLKSGIRFDISKLMLLNMQAIEHKSIKASHTAETATWWITITGALCFLIAFISLTSLPGNIADPIEELTESIKEIADQNYQQRVHFKSHSEFGNLAKSFNTMAEKLEEYSGSSLARVLMEKKRIETLINNMRDPVLGLDENEKILFANEEMLKITGKEKESLVGEKMQSVAQTNDLIRMLSRGINDTQSEGMTSKPLKIYADKKESYFEKEIIDINIIPTGETAPKGIGQVIILKNVTPFKELDVAKTNFIATISHELKTPISSIKMSVQVLENPKTGVLNAEQSQLLDSIKEDSARLLKITAELLNMTQAETGNIQLNMQKSSVYDVLQYALDATRIQAEQRNLRVTIDLEKDIHLITMDPEKTAWVLTNLISNAIRYSPENGEVIVSVKEDIKAVCFTVQDFGKGIESQYREKIFDRYFQVPGSSKAGSGLGLAIGKEFIEAQGGCIGVDTEPGLGSSFFFCLPYAL